MDVSPYLYHLFVRPKWMTQKYIYRHIENNFDFKNKRVLDFGSGTGANCKMCTPTTYHGVDPDHKRIQFANRLYPDYRFSVLDGNALPVEDNSCDYVMIVAVLHHISSEQITQYLEEFRRILAPNGKIVVIEPYLSDHTPISNRFMNWYDKGEYIRKEHDYLELFNARGFSCDVISRFKKGFLYNEVFFYASPSK